MRLQLSHPEVAYRSCEDCLKYMYDHKTGRLFRNADGTPQPRPPGSKAPCQATVKAPFDVRARICAKVSPDAGIELSDRNQAALEHYLRCRATGRFPDDPLVANNASIIRMIFDAHESNRLVNSITAMLTSVRR